MKHCIIHPSEYYADTCPSCDRERASSSLQQDGSAWCPFCHADPHTLGECLAAASRPALERALIRANEALRRIRNFPVHSEPVGGAYAMQEIAHEALTPND